MATIAGGAFLLAEPQFGGQRVIQVQAPVIEVPTAVAWWAALRRQEPAVPTGAPVQMPVMSAELVRAYMEAAERNLDYLPGRVLVKFKDGVDPAGQASALRVLGRSEPTPSDLEWSGDMAIVKDSSGLDPKILAERLEMQPEVAYAQPDYLLKIDAAPNDPSYGARQWNFHQLNMSRAWDLVDGGDPSVIVAVVDTGITAQPVQNITVQTWSGSAIVSHTMPVGPSPDFTLSRFVMPRDFTISTTNPPQFVVDSDGHGTHVGGTIGENTNNGIALAGMAYNVRIMPLKACQSYWDVQFALSAAGFTGFAPLNAGGCPTSATNAAIRFAADNGAKVLNYSIGGTSPNPTIRDAMAYAISRGVFVAMSNGNNFETGNPTSYPASYAPGLDGAMSVAAMTRIDTKSYYSTTGVQTEIAAYGGDQRQGNLIWQQSLLSTDSDEATVIFPRFDRYSERGFQGTSMASPHVAGLAALLVSQIPGIKPEQIEFIIRTTARDLGTPGRDDVFGHGQIQPRTALFGRGIR